MEELISHFFMLRLAKRWNLVLLLPLFISQLLSFVLHLLFLGNQFWSVLGLFTSLASLHGTGVQEFLDSLYISNRKRQTESSCFHSHCFTLYFFIFNSWYILKVRRVVQCLGLRHLGNIWHVLGRRGSALPLFCWPSPASSLLCRWFLHKGTFFPSFVPCDAPGFLG